MHEVAIVGTGIGGITAAAKLLDAGIDDFVMLERAESLGGTWRDNTYPGIGVDIPSVLYQFEWARKPDFSRLLAPGDEVLRYLVDAARSLGIDRKMRFNAEVVREEFDDDAHVWRLTTAAGDKFTARFVISARGPFTTPKVDPGIAGVEDFEGKLQRTASWDHDYEHRGKRVAVIGTGASGVQLVPAIAPDVGELLVFQRTPVWVVPRPNFEVPGVVKAALGMPGVLAGINGAVIVGVDTLSRIFSAPRPVFAFVAGPVEAGLRMAYRGYLRTVVDDPADRAALAPWFGFLAKRPTGSAVFLQTFNRSNASLVTTPIERVTPRGIRTIDGAEHELDMIVLATGYEMHNDHRSYPPGSIVGRAGFDQGAFYAREGVQAYEGVAVKGIPNRWMTSGPYCWTGGIDWFRVVEVTATHAVRAIAEARRRGATLIEVSEEAHDRHQAEVLRRRRNLDDYFRRQTDAGVNTYFVNSQGEASAVRPIRVLEARRRARSFSFHDYTFARAEGASRAEQERTAA